MLNDNFWVQIETGLSHLVTLSYHEGMRVEIVGSRSHLLWS